LLPRVRKSSGLSRSPYHYAVFKVRKNRRGRMTA
jgi:hypothetical protein